MDYTGEEAGEEAGSTGGLNGLALPARSPPATPRPSRAGAPSAAAVADRAAGHGGAGGARHPLEGCA